MHINAAPCYVNRRLDFMNHIFICSLAISLLVASARADELPSATTPAPDKSQYTLFNPTPLELRRAYNTDRPSKTDSPYTIDAGVFQIEMDVANWTLNENNVDGTNVRSAHMANRPDELQGRPDELDGPAKFFRRVM